MMIITVGKTITEQFCQLDEPFADIYDMHHNDEILVGLIDQVDEPYLLGLPYKK